MSNNLYLSVNLIIFFLACPPECTECEWDQTAGNVVCKVDKCETGYSQTSADICIGM